MILDFSASINPLGPPLRVLQAMREGLQVIKAYPDPNYPELKEALSQEHQVEPDWILPGNGSAALLTWAARDLAQQSLTYLLTPAFADYQRALQAFGARVKTYSLAEELPPETVVVGQGLLLNNPHNPTGKLWSSQSLLPYLDSCSLVVVDEAFMDFLPPQEQQSLIPWVEKYQNLVILRSLTKFYSLPGLRLGYAVGHPDRLRRWQQWQDPWSVNSLAVVAALAALTDRRFQEETWQWLPPTRGQLYQSLQSLSFCEPLPSQANFVLVRTKIPSSQLQGYLLREAQILIRDCLSFPELGDNYFRVAVLEEKNNQRLLSALARVEKNPYGSRL